MGWDTVCFGHFCLVVVYDACFNPDKIDWHGFQKTRLEYKKIDAFTKAKDWGSSFFDFSPFGTYLANLAWPRLCRSSPSSLSLRLRFPVQSSHLQQPIIMPPIATLLFQTK